MGRPVLFVQTRPGLRGRPFQMVKFRTMAAVSDERGNLLPDSQRLTPFGRFLRSTSLDELPELWTCSKVYELGSAPVPCYGILAAVLAGTGKAA
jgi:lipopolysaccharide/colanic/teichoic acid biosynthesis glycosyltransferase